MLYGSLGRHCFSSLFILLVAASIASSTDAGPALGASARISDPHRAQAALAAFDRSPAIFVENRGQWDARIRYVFNGKGVNVLFTADGPVFELFGPADHAEESGVSKHLVRARFIGSSKIAPEGLDPSQAQMNYYTGGDHSRWRSGVPSFHRVCYRNIYDGIDLYCWGRRNGLKYEFHVAPGADWRRIKLACDGMSDLRIDQSGALCARGVLGEMIDEAPVAYQETPSGRVPVECSYRLAGSSSYGFDVSGPMDPSLALVIDPDLAWSTFIGGYLREVAYGITVDEDGNLYAAGYTESPDFPTLDGYDDTHNGPVGGSDAFVARFSPAGALVWSTFFGGGSWEAASATAAYASSAVYVVGDTSSTDFPTLGDHVRARVSGTEVFVAKFSSSGALVWSTYLGGTGSDESKAVCTDADGGVYVAGQTYSSNFPTVDAYDSTFNGGYVDGFVIKYASDGEILWSTFVGGSQSDRAFGLACYAADAVYLTGETNSANFPVTSTYDDSLSVPNDAFLMKFTTAGELVWSTYLGGDGGDGGRALATDSSGNVCITGHTGSGDFPVSSSYDSTLGGDFDVFAAQFSAAGVLIWSTYLGGSSDDFSYALAVDGADDVYVGGSTKSTDFPVYRAYDDTFNQFDANEDAFVTKFSSSGGLLWSTYLGGSSYDVVYGLAAFGTGAVYAAGSTYSDDFPVEGGYNSEFGGNGDAFITKLTDSPALEPFETVFVVRQLSIVRNSQKPDADKFLLKASLNLTGTSVDWNAADVTVAVGPYEQTLPAGSFVTKNGIAYLYTAPKGTSSGILRALVDLKKRTVYVSAAGLDMSSAGTDIDVSLDAGDFAGAFALRMPSRGGFNYGRTGQILTDVFMVDKAMFVLNTRQAGKDRLTIMGSIYSTEALDLASEDFGLTVGDQSWALPAGSFVKKGKGQLYVYKGPRGSQLTMVSVDLTKGVFKISAANLSLGAPGGTVEISVEAETFAGTSTISPIPKGSNLIY